MSITRWRSSACCRTPIPPMRASCRRRRTCSPPCSPRSSDAEPDRIRIMVTTLSTLGESDLLRSQFTGLQSNIQQLQTQLATGEKTQAYGDLGAQVPLDISLRN